MADIPVIRRRQTVIRVPREGFKKFRGKSVLRSPWCVACSQAIIIHFGNLDCTWFSIDTSFCDWLAADPVPVGIQIKEGRWPRCDASLGEKRSNRKTAPMGRKSIASESQETGVENPEPLGRLEQGEKSQRCFGTTQPGTGAYDTFCPAVVDGRGGGWVSLLPLSSKPAIKWHGDGVFPVRSTFIEVCGKNWKTVLLDYTKVNPTHILLGGR